MRSGRFAFLVDAFSSCVGGLVCRRQTKTSYTLLCRPSRPNHCLKVRCGTDHLEFLTRSVPTIQITCLKRQYLSVNLLLKVSLTLNFGSRSHKRHLLRRLTLHEVRSANPQLSSEKLSMRKPDGGYLTVSSLIYIPCRFLIWSISSVCVSFLNSECILWKARR